MLIPVQKYVQLYSNVYFISLLGVPHLSDPSPLLVPLSAHHFVHKVEHVLAYSSYCSVTNTIVVGVRHSVDFRNEQVPLLVVAHLQSLLDNVVPELVLHH